MILSVRAAPKWLLILLKIRLTVSRLSLLKKIRVKLINVKVIKTNITFIKNELVFLKGEIFNHSLCTTNPNPFKPPQIINNHELPCQKPPKSIVTNKLILVLTLCFTLGKKYDNKTNVIARHNNTNNNHIFPVSRTKITDKKTIQIYDPTVPFLLPPKGMYKYSFSHDDKEMCQRFQNSLTSCDL